MLTPAIVQPIAVELPGEDQALVDLQLQRIEHAAAGRLSGGSSVLQMLGDRRCGECGIRCRRTPQQGYRRRGGEGGCSCRRQCTADDFLHPKPVRRRPLPSGANSALSQVVGELPSRSQVSPALPIQDTRGLDAAANEVARAAFSSGPPEPPTSAFRAANTMMRDRGHTVSEDR